MSEQHNGGDEPPKVFDAHPELDEFRSEVFRGLAAQPKTLPTKYLYDDKGSVLFDDITDQPEYYPTRTELGIMRESMTDIARVLGPRVELIEPGSGSGLKTRLLIEGLTDIAAYVPIEISRDHLDRHVEAFRAEYPELEILPVCADFTQHTEIPDPSKSGARRVVYFPGSTIGNLTKQQRHDLLANFADLAGRDGGLLIGVDMVKDAEALEAAYNDDAGVTAEFNLNLLDRINRELDADFDRDAFTHRAVWDHEESRIEMRLYSDKDQAVTIGGRAFDFAEGEHVRTEYSHKFQPEWFAGEARTAGFELDARWTDERAWFSLFWFVRTGEDVVTRKSAPA